MSAPTQATRHLLAYLTSTALATLCLWFAAPGTALAAAAASEPAAQHLRIARQRPPCANLSGMPIVPNDPGALTTRSGTRCYGTRPPELELWLPQDRYVWLEQNTPNPAAWITLGPVVVDPLSLESPPLGLRLAKSDELWTLEARHDQTSTLTPLEPGTWTKVTSPDGQRFWVQLGDAHRAAASARGRVRRAD